ncbi:hypothetical protein M3Y96_00351500 [Aphelenchoides besseyi]|nr:hypothetical protein M3Y96_00351500 [Aphelenchoides besseyi]
MAVGHNRDKNFRKSKLKLSKKNAVVFKKSSAKSMAMDVDVAEKAINDVEMDSSAVEKPKTKVKLSKKRLLRQQRKAELRKCYESKRQKTRLLVPDAMEDAAAPEESEKPKQKINEQRLRKDELPIQMSSKNAQRKIQLKEMSNSKSNVVSGRRMSKKKARKVLNAANRAQRERERTQNAMDI